MDNLVLHRLALDLSAEVAGAVLSQARQEAADRFRLVFARDDASFSLLISLDPETPWIGTPALPWEGPRWTPDAPVATLAKRIAGLRIAHVHKPRLDRSVRLEADDGSGLVIELQPHASNLVLLGPGGVIEIVVRSRQRSAERLSAGIPWAPPSCPPGRSDPLEATAADLDSGLERFLGLGPTAPALARAEASRSGRPFGEVLAGRLAEVREGRSDVVAVGPEPLRQAIESATLVVPAFRLLPWRPANEDEGHVFEERTPLLTAGLFHDGVEAVGRLCRRVAALQRIVRGEIRKAVETGARVDSERARFEAPDELARRAEAILAGLTVAERVKDGVAVPDPYDPAGAPIVVAVPPGVPLPAAANDLFRKSRRARRGLEAVAERSAALSRRALRLEAIAGRAQTARTADDAAALEEAMRGEGIAVGIARATRAGRAADRLEAPRIAGVRVITSSDGWSILVGKTARDNDRLTFKLASPDDLWLHAAGTTGAHVVVKAAGRGDVPDATLREAAQAAAWFSDARSQGAVEVHWARRKHVRRAGGAAGRVVLKRFETLRVRAVPPSERK
ncbi:MAG TPA: NFACT RNA binding domain-containing protein [Candidatus Polarisedimenticolaceae bacterium]|nr:NFACT RNA binding domain-containing protein [Candidatus Polarisedimenticolaceae bacterium]